MTNIAISVRGLGKRYRITRPKSGLNGRHPLERIAKNTVGYLANSLRKPHDDEILWAIRDVSFDVGRGEVLGIIGENGAGKSTLLKIVARITEPTMGKAIVRGRVGSLLETGTGFHPELTGRENIFLSGSIFGMRKAEIANRFDEIVDFSGIGEFIDMPFKRYSSGMKVRLGFSVAAHLEPENMMIDEVLAVGDAEFQKRCIGKMGSLATGGRTIIFVSHRMVAIESLCDRVLWLQDGRISHDGPTKEGIQRYLETAAPKEETIKWPDFLTAPGTDDFRFHTMRVSPAKNADSHLISVRTPVAIEFEFWNLIPDSRVYMNIQIVTSTGTIAFESSPVHDPSLESRPLPAGRFRTICLVPGDLLNAGKHSVRVRVAREGRVIYRHQRELQFDVIDSADRHDTYYQGGVGVVRPLLNWSTEQLDSSIPSASIDRTA